MFSPGKTLLPVKFPNKVITYKVFVTYMMSLCSLGKIFLPRGRGAVWSPDLRALKVTCSFSHGMVGQDLLELRGVPSLRREEPGDRSPTIETFFSRSMEMAKEWGSPWGILQYTRRGNGGTEEEVEDLGVATTTTLWAGGERVERRTSLGLTIPGTRVRQFDWL